MDIHRRIFFSKRQTVASGCGLRMLNSRNTPFGVTSEIQRVMHIYVCTYVGVYMYIYAHIYIYIYTRLYAQNNNSNKINKHHNDNRHNESGEF